MTTQDVKRKLAAILSADVKGYSRLMGEDEVGTIRTLNTYKELMANLIQQYHGRVVDAPGDNLLADFGSIVDAVKCGVEIQKELKVRNAEVPENRRMEFRIGINLGDVIEEGDKIFGDGVNIAARLESLSEAGGIGISGTAFDQVKNKLPLGYEYLGEHTVKNIPEPVRVYRVLMEPEAVGKVIGERKVRPRPWNRSVLIVGAILILVVAGFVIWRFFLHPSSPPVEVASKEKMAFPLPDKPSIAVLPFANMSEDPKQEYFSDGITEEIITALSKVPRLFVIARNSTFTYKGKSVKVRQVSEELGVRYVLEGSVRKSGDKVRITAQLIDALTGHHLWAERYDRDLKDIFALQDEITMKIITALRVNLTDGEVSRIHAKGTINLEAHLKFLQARELILRTTKESILLGRQLLEEAIALDPKWARPYSTLANIYIYEILLGASKSPTESIAKGIELCQRGIAMDPSLAHPHGILSVLYAQKREYEKAIAEAEIALSLEPNSADANLFLPRALLFSGRSEEAIPLLLKAIRLSPFPQPRVLQYLGDSYLNTGRYEEAVATYKKLLERLPTNLMGHIGLTATYSMMGREFEARAQAAELLKIDPKFSVERFAKTLPYKKQVDVDRIVEALRKVGLK